MIEKKRIILPVIVLLSGILTAVGLTALKSPPERKAESRVMPQVEVQRVSFGPMQQYVDSHGVVKSRHETNLVAQVEGEIVFIADEFVRGGMVKAGQLLARIDPGDYEVKLSDARSRLVSAQAGLALEKAQAHVAAIEWQKITSSTPTDLGLRKPQLARELANVKAAEAAIERAEHDLQRTSIRAPYDALISSREIGLGSYVTRSTAIGSLLDVSVAEIRLPVADKDLGYLDNHGIGAAVQLRAEYAGEEIVWPATIVRSEGVIDDTSRMTYLVAAVARPYNSASAGNTLPVLRFGTYVTAKIKGVSLSGAALVPGHLLKGNRIATLDNDEKLRFKPVTLYRRQGANVIVTKGLADGDRIITSAIAIPLDGMRLELAEGSAGSRVSGVAVNKGALE